MLIEFSVGNYKSFKELVTFSMLAAKISAQDRTLDRENVFELSGVALLKSAAIYGANASGKSNLTSAIRFMKTLVRSSSKETQVDESIPIDLFRLSDDTKDQPAIFQIIFILEGTKYRYGFSLNQEQIVSEWLFYNKTNRETRLFTREFDDINISDNFKEGKGIADKTRNNALFLSVVAQFNGNISQKILRWFHRLNVISGLNDQSYRAAAERIFQTEYRDDIMNIIKEFDIGIDDISMERIDINNDHFPKNIPSELKDVLLKAMPHRNIINTFHKKYCGDDIILEQFDIDKDESEGTKKLFALAGPLIDTLRNGKILVIDELDARLHPLITRAIIELFNSSKSNIQNAQLIFTTHDTNLLSNKLLRRDQVWFAEKDRYGSTHLHSLVEYKVRNDAPFEKDYISGKYGAIPFIGDIENILGDHDEEA